jgi:electron transfer flavoprotein beta subunit
VEEVLSLSKNRIKARRAIEGGYEILEAPLPVLMTVVDANEPRPPSARKIMKFKKAVTRSELVIQHANANYTDAEQLAEEEDNKRKSGLWINEWSAADVEAKLERIGLKGSPTKVKQIQNVILTSGNFKNIEPSETGINSLIHELIEDHTLG